MPILSPSRRPVLPTAHVSRIALALVLSLTVAACSKTRRADTTGSINTSAPQGQDAWRQQVQMWGQRYEASPNDRNVVLNYARALRATDQHTQATAVLESAVIKSPKDAELAGAYGKALIDVGRFKQALEVLSRAHRPEQPDWRILSAQGTASDQMGDHGRAQKYYEAALKIEPDDAGTLSNLGLSYALTKRLPEAERTLRRAAQNPRADMRVRQNLALVLGLQGRFDEAEKLIRQDLSGEDAAANIAFLRKSVSQSNSWQTMKALDKKDGKNRG